MVNLLYWVGGGLGLCKIHCVSSDSNFNVTNYTATLHDLARPAGVSVVVQACDESPPCDALVRKLFPLLHLFSRSATRCARTTSILRLTGVANLAWQLPFPVLSLLPFPSFRFTLTFNVVFHLVKVLKHSDMQVFWWAVYRLRLKLASSLRSGETLQSDP